MAGRYSGRLSPERKTSVARFVQNIRKGHGQSSDGECSASAPDCRSGDAVLFARKGFRGVTTREIAAAAGVSEGLVFRYFPTKAALYQDIFQLGRLADPDLMRLASLPASTDTLILMTYAMVHHLVLGALGKHEPMITRLRLVLHSMIEDGEYARIHFAEIERRFLPVYTDSLRAAEQAGDVRAGGPAPANALWFGAHVAAQIAYGRLSGGGVFPYQGDLDGVVAEAARFILRGIGLSDEMIAVPFDLQRLALFADFHG